MQDCDKFSKDVGVIIPRGVSSEAFESMVWLLTEQVLVRQKELIILDYYFSLPYHVKQMIIFK